MKKLSKLLSIIVLALMLLTITSNIVLATGITDPKNIIGTAPTGNGIQNVGKKVVGIIQTVGSVISVVVLVVLGIKYMMGSTEEKAEYKKTLMPYLIGAVLIFAASNLASVVFNFATQITTT